MLEVIEQVRTGSHNEFHPRVNYQTGEADPKHGWNQTVTDFETVYHDSLVPKEWLKEHEHDLDGYEPTIELSIDGKSLSVNGNYKQGVIRDFMASYTAKVRAGKKTMTITKSPEDN